MTTLNQQTVHEINSSSSSIIPVLSITPTKNSNQSTKTKTL